MKMKNFSLRFIESQHVSGGPRAYVLIVTSLSEASARGSKGAFARASNTQGRLHVGRNFRAGGRSKKKRAPNQSETVL